MSVNLKNNNTSQWIDNFRNPDSLNEQINNSEQQIQNIFKLIESCESLDDAETHFQVLEEFQYILSQALFKYDLQLSKWLINFVRDFDRVDDLDMKQHLFCKITNGEYTL